MTVDKYAIIELFPGTFLKKKNNHHHTHTHTKKRVNHPSSQLLAIHLWLFQEDYCILYGIQYG